MQFAIAIFTIGAVLVLIGLVGGDLSYRGLTVPKVGPLPRFTTTITGGVFLAFSLWDWLAIRRGHWSYSSTYLTGIELLGIPLEELVFFLVVPTCALLTYQAVVRLFPARAPR